MKLAGADADSEREIRLRIAFMGAVLPSTCDRIDGRDVGAAINHRLKPHLVRRTFDSCRAQTIEGHSG
jgi:hypothetical protein